MREYLDTLQKCPLFSGMGGEEICSVLACMNARMIIRRKGETILLPGDPVREIGVVLSGSVRVERVDYQGKRSVMARITPGQLFAEAFACAQAKTLPLSVCAAEDARVMFVDAQRIIKSCGMACGFHTQLIQNLMHILALKNIVCQQKIEAVTQRTTREKLMTYLMSCAAAADSTCFSVPFDRQELADYLAVDRSGLSAEIGKLRREGVIRCEKNRFELL